MKVAYNACYGGFTLSEVAIRLGRKLSGDPAWGGPCLEGDDYGDGTKVEGRYYGGGRELPRDDATLITVIQKLKAKANTDYSSLQIAEVATGDRWRIDEYDGFESVKTVNDYDWQVAS